MCKCKITCGLTLYSFLFVVYFVIGDYTSDLLSKQRLTNDTLEVITYRYSLTVWNLMLQMIFMPIAFLDELISAFTQNPSIFRTPRAYLFTTFVFPLTTVICSAFWMFYFYDRETIYPRDLDADIPSFLNVFAHFFIILLVVVEIFITRRHEFRPFRSSLVALLAFLVIYNISLFLVHYRDELWLYPFYKRMSNVVVYLWTIFTIFIFLCIQKCGEILLMSIRRCHSSKNSSHPKLVKNKPKKRV